MTGMSPPPTTRNSGIWALCSELAQGGRQLAHAEREESEGEPEKVPGGRARVRLVGQAGSWLGLCVGLLAPLRVQAQKRPDSGAMAKGAGSSPQTPSDLSTPEAQLARAKLAYQRGDYGAAVLQLRPLLYPQSLLSQEEQVMLAHKLLALSYFFEHDESGAEQELNLLLSLRPDFALDPLVDPLKAVAFLDDIRRRNEQRLAEIRRRQTEEIERQRSEADALQKQAELLAQQQARRIYIERVVQRKFSGLSLLPLGIPQFVGGRKALGAVLATGEILTAAASVGSWMTVRYRYPTSTFPAKEYTLAQALTATYLTTGVVFWGLCLTGLVDSLINARATTTVQELPGPPPELRPRSATRAAQLTGLRVDGVVPLLDLPAPAQSSVGLAVIGRY